MVDVGIIGASGFTGVELLRLCASHPELEVRLATGDTMAGTPIAELYPSLAGAYADRVFDSFDVATDAGAVDGLDLVFLGLPHGASQAIVPEVRSRVPHVVDLAADFRLDDPAQYPVWYGDEHAAPELLDEFAYGLPELFRDSLKGAPAIAVPGCYPTAGSLALAPLVKAGAVQTDSLIVDAASGVSGAGRGPKANTSFCTVDEDFTAYGLLTHRHTPEFEQNLSTFAGLDPSAVTVLFTPHLAPMNRGILATCYARPTEAFAHSSTAELLAVMHHQYDAEPFVTVIDGSPSTKSVLGSNGVHVTARFDERTGFVIAICAIDNLTKGASGGAVQCANLALDLPETLGLSAIGVYPVSVTAARGFVAAGIASGIKESGDPDLSLVATADGTPVPAAGVFTANLMTAAPVQTTRRHLAHTSGRAAAVILNSGNANAATGEAGLADAQAMRRGVATGLGCDPHEVLVCSTGLIGIPLPIDTITTGIPGLVDARTADGGAAAAEAIRTTDTFRKEVVITGTAADGTTFTVGGMAKGAAMLAPNMATMLAVLTTDAAAGPDQLTLALQQGVAGSFNVMSVDGCQSTNDTVLLLASGQTGPVDQTSLFDAVARACRALAEAMVLDAEGATKSVRIEVVGAASDAEAAAGARKVADSNLCKCSWYGQDPYWGRIASELGSAGIAFDQSRISIGYGGITVAAGGITIEHDEAAVTDHMAGRYLHIIADLGVGDGTGSIFTNDLTHAYVDENMGTS